MQETDALAAWLLHTNISTLQLHAANAAALIKSLRAWNELYTMSKALWACKRVLLSNGAAGQNVADTDLDLQGPDQLKSQDTLTFVYCAYVHQVPGYNVICAWCGMMEHVKQLLCVGNFEGLWTVGQYGIHSWYIYLDYC